jgi:hypothetical protein
MDVRRTGPFPFCSLVHCDTPTRPCAEPLTQHIPLLARERLGYYQTGQDEQNAELGTDDIISCDLRLSGRGTGWWRRDADGEGGSQRVGLGR